MSEVRETLPLFPLGTVLFPGMALPLHVFEERYRRLVHDLLERPDGRFGVVTITQGHEVGAGAVRDMADVGCVAELQDVQTREDGRFDIVATGTDRFRIDRLDDSGPYVRADVVLLPEPTGRDADVLAGWVNILFRAYRERLRTMTGVGGEQHLVVDDPVRLSYLVAGSVLTERPEQLALLRAEDAAARLRLEVAILRREMAVLRVLPSLPAVEAIRRGVSPN